MRLHDPSGVHALTASPTPRARLHGPQSDTRAQRARPECAPTWPLRRTLALSEPDPESAPARPSVGHARTSMSLHGTSGGYERIAYPTRLRACTAPQMDTHAQQAQPRRRACAAPQAYTRSHRARYRERACASPQVDTRAQRARFRGRACVYPQADTRAQRARPRGRACVTPHADTRAQRVGPEGAPERPLRRPRASASTASPATRGSCVIHRRTHAYSEPDPKGASMRLHRRTRAHSEPDPEGATARAPDGHERTASPTLRARLHDPHAYTCAQRTRIRGRACVAPQQNTRYSEQNPEGAPTRPLRRMLAHREPDREGAPARPLRQTRAGTANTTPTVRRRGPQADTRAQRA